MPVFSGPSSPAGLLRPVFSGPSSPARLLRPVFRPTNFKRTNFRRAGSTVPGPISKDRSPERMGADLPRRTGLGLDIEMRARPNHVGPADNRCAVAQMVTDGHAHRVRK